MLGKFSDVMMYRDQSMSKNDCGSGIVTATPGHTIGSKKTSLADDFIIITTGISRPSKRGKVIDEEEPLVDTTAALQLHSKKTNRAQKRLQKKQAKASKKPAVTQLFDLPPELLFEILTHLPPSDVFPLLLVNRTFQNFILENERSIARNIIRRRYWVLAQCFFLPVAMHDLDGAAKSALLSDRRQEMLQTRMKSWEHIKGIDPLKICTCATCALAWNHLCMVLDLAHWQKNLDEREPLPIIKRGTIPEWNTNLLDVHASVVEKAIARPLTYARILEKHLATTAGTILRTIRRKYNVDPRRLYYLTASEAKLGTDEFLERSGPRNLEFPWRRDSYHYIEAYVPHRHWSEDKEKWVYYAQSWHEKDIGYIVAPPSRRLAVSEESIVVEKSMQAVSGRLQTASPVDVGHEITLRKS